jgi:DNA-binding transcriptional LysR family regulator
MYSTPTAESLLKRGLKLSHLRLLSALADVGQITQAAERIGMAQPAASRLLAEVERIVGQPVHVRTGRGMVLTAVGAALALRVRRIWMELRDAVRELAEVTSGGAGHVRIGSVTGPAIDRVLPVLRNARLTAPQITAEVVVAPSDILSAHLLEGRIDFAIGRMPQGNERALFRLVPIATEPVSLVVRRDHPLIRQKSAELTDLMIYDWVMPPPDSVLTRVVLARLAAHGMPAPPQRLSTASFLLTFALVQQSNAIAPLAHAVAASFCNRPDAAFALLALDLGIEVEPFGLLTLEASHLTPVAARLAHEICTLEP